MGKSSLSFLLMVCIVLESLCNTLFLNDDFYDKAYTSITYFVVGILISLFPLLPSRNPANWLISARISKGILALGLIMMGSFLYIEARAVFEKVPVDIRWADMLPIMKIMCERLVAGKSVYANIEQIWAGIEPIYLPAIWLPLLPATMMEVDVRWTAMLLFMGALIFCLSTRPRLKLPGQQNFLSLLVLVPLLILVHHWMIYESRFFSMTEESIVVFYYLFLAFAIARKTPVLIALALSLCMLSRYSLAIWAVVYVFYEFLLGNRKAAIRITWVGGLFSLFLLIATQAIWHLDIFLGLPANYLDAIIHEEHKFGALVQDGLGLAKFYEYSDLPKLNRLFLVAAILSPILSFTIFHFLRAHINKELFLLCSLKLSLVLFYNTLIMPFVYLFFTSTLFSLAILNFYLNYDPPSSAKLKTA